MRFLQLLVILWINKGKNRKYPEMSKPKGFRSLRAFQCPEKGICTKRCLILCKLFVGPCVSFFAEI